MISILVTAVQIISTVLIMIVIVDVFLSYVLSPYHPLRATLDKWVNPLLTPIRKLLPRFSIDFSPVVLILVIQVIEYLLVSLLIRLV